MSGDSGFREPPEADSQRSFGGTERYIVETQLGEGGFGIVYRVFDRERGERVALKTLRNLHPESLYQFKREFRSLANVNHDNLVSLYELVADEGQWFFTMQLVEGTDFLSWVRPAFPAMDEESLSAETAEYVPGPTITPPDMGGSLTVDSLTDQGLPKADLMFDEPRLRAAMGQLALGVDALHREGKLHRDIKPSNVQVTPAGHVCLLDFGLVKEARSRKDSQTRAVVGTAAYMSPEQAMGQPVSEPSDWYSVGAVLYEALSGRLPHEGTAMEMLVGKSTALPPARLPVGVPHDLGTLCMRLLEHSPDQRPAFEEVALVLGVAPSDRAAEAEDDDEVCFVGRRRELESLGAAFEASRDGQPVVAHLYGTSGMGKSALAEHFLQGLAEERDAVVLRGRCYERESVPFKALDALVDDALCGYLRRLDRAGVGQLMPREVWALARLFPVLERVSVVAEAPRPRVEIPDRQEVRRRAFSALQELLARIADRHPLVLFIDDLQWGDLDSAALLAELVRGSHAPAMLLVLSYRGEERERSSFLRALLADEQLGGDEHHVAVNQLDDEEAQLLASTLLGPGRSDLLAAAIARESGGNPFFVHALIQYLETQSGPAELDSGLTMEQVLDRWITALPDDARRLLEVVAVAGYPIESKLAAEAARIEGDEREAFAALQKARLVRGAGGDVAGVEVFHDRIRAGVVERLSRGAGETFHRRLAAAIELSDRADPERLAIHLEGAGETARASSYAAEAARRASAALAFERAAALYRKALELGFRETEERRTLQRALGDALVNAGCGTEAADAYLDAARGAAPNDDLELRCMATGQLMISGRFDRGVELLRTVLADIGMKLPETPRAALALLLRRRGQLWLRGLECEARAEADIPAEKLRRVDTTWAVSSSLALNDHILGACFQVQNLLLALDAGDVRRVARALALEAGFLAAYGGKTATRTAGLIERTRSLVTRVGDPHSAGLERLMSGSAAWLAGRWQESLELVDEAAKVFTEQCTGVAWELDTSRIFALGALYYLGRWRELSRRAPRCLLGAQERGDLYEETWMRVRFLPVGLLAGDDPDAAMRSIDEGLDAWPGHAFGIPHWWALYGRVHVWLYQGVPDRAWDAIQASWSPLQRSLIPRIQVHFFQTLNVRASTALAVAATLSPGAPGRAALVRQAARDARRIGREKMSWARPFAQRIGAAVRHLSGHSEQADGPLETAEIEFAAADMPLHAAAVRRQRGRLAGGEDGRELIAAADTVLVREGIVDPARMADTLVPGFA